MSLTDYGVLARSPVRQPATDRSGMCICPECGKPVEGTRGTHVLNAPESADSEYSDLPSQVRVFGFVCDLHVTRVVLPLETDAQTSNLPDGWVGVRLRFADELARYVPVLERELPASRSGTEVSPRDRRCAFWAGAPLTVRSDLYRIYGFFSTF